jgi:ABC-2 type transport system ATP-binding protein
VDEVLSLCGLADVADDLIEWLSHGYRQRVGIAIAVAHEPKLVVLDEPISGLDPAQIVAMRGLIRGLKEKHTVLLSSHILSEISHTCDRILVLHQGRIVAQGNEASLAAGLSAPVEILARGKVGDAERAELARLEGVSGLEVEAAGEGLVRLRARLTSDAAREQLVATLVQRGLGVRSVVDSQTGLESVFLKLTQGGEA